jgi:hypothetical protein
LSTSMRLATACALALISVHLRFALLREAPNTARSALLPMAYLRVPLCPSWLAILGVGFPLTG